MPFPVAGGNIAKLAYDNADEAKQTANSVRDEFDRVVAEAGSNNPEVVQARGTAASLKARLDSNDVLLEENTTKLNYGMAPAPLKGVAVTNNYTGVLPIESYNGWLYGVDVSTLKRSNDYGATWQTVATLPASGVHTLIWTTDGEVVIASPTNIWKSTGWANPSTVTWNLKVTKSSPVGPGIRRWGIDGDGNKFIATEYSGADRSESKYVWISLDKGTTWNIAVDKDADYPGSGSHMHGVCYDKWEDRFWLSHGHGTIMGTYYSDDDGVTWIKLGGAFQPDAAPTTLTATDSGIVCGSDSGDGGIYGIARTENPSDMEMKPIARWNVLRSGVTGFATRGHRDPKTGHVYVSFKSDFDNVNSVIMAGTAYAGATVWESPTSGLTSFEYNVVHEDTIFGVITRIGVNELVKGKLSYPVARTFDNGNVLGGESKNSTTVAVGAKAKSLNGNETVVGVNATTTGVDNATVVGFGAKGDTRTVAIGSGAVAKDDDSIAIGFGAISDGLNILTIGSGATTFLNATGSIAIGKGSKSATAGTAIGASAKSGVGSGNTGTVAIGYNASADGVNTTVIGHSASTFANATGGTAIGQGAKASFASTAIGSGAQADANGTSGIAIGYGATVTGTEAVAIGREATAGTRQVAIGKGAVAAHTNSVVIGYNSASTDSNQFQLGARHIEITEVSLPNAPAANGARLFSQDNGAGKTQLCVRFNTGAVVVLATEA